MFHISVHSASRQAAWIFSILDRCHSISGLCRTIKYYSLPHCFLSESKCQHLKDFCTNFANLKQQLDAYALFFKVCHFLKKQKLHWTQYMVTLHSNACHNFEINNTRPGRFYCSTINEFCTTRCSCGEQGVTGDRLTLQQKDPSADQCGSLPMVVEKCPSEQILWDILLTTETFVFHIQFLQNSIQ